MPNFKIISFDGKKRVRSIAYLRGVTKTKATSLKKQAMSFPGIKSAVVKPMKVSTRKNPCGKK